VKEEDENKKRKRDERQRTTLNGAFSGISGRLQRAQFL